MPCKIIRVTTVPQSVDLFEGTIPLLSKKYDVHYLSSPGQVLNQISDQYGITVNDVEMYRRFSPVKDLKSLVQLIRVFRKERPYMIHSMPPKAGLLCLMITFTTHAPVSDHTFVGPVWQTET